jgi:hypothetical protein
LAQLLEHVLKVLNVLLVLVYMLFDGAPEILVAGLLRHLLPPLDELVLGVVDGA